jgi:hypothetical protein
LVLLVDPNASRRRRYGFHLRLQGFLVLTAASYEAARRLLALLLPRVVVAHRALGTSELSGPRTPAGFNDSGSLPLVVYGGPKRGDAVPGTPAVSGTPDDVVAAIRRVLLGLEPHATALPQNGCSYDQGAH